MPRLHEHATDVYEGPSDNPRVLVHQLRAVAASLRALGVGVQADFVDKLAERMSETPTLQGMLQSLEHPKALHTNRTVFYLAGLLMNATDLLRELSADAEITGSHAAIDRVHEFFRILQIDP